MKLTDKRLLILLIVIANAAVASAQSFFSVEEISKTEYTEAEKECSRYNVIPADSIPDNEIVSMVLKESQNKFERFDSVTRQEITYFDEGFGFSKQRLLYLPELKLYGSLYQTIHSTILYGGLTLRAADTCVMRHPRQL